MKRTGTLGVGTMHSGGYAGRMVSYRARGTGEVNQWLKHRLPEDPDSIPRIYLAAYNCL